MSPVVVPCASLEHLLYAPCLHSGVTSRVAATDPEFLLHASNLLRTALQLVQTHSVSAQGLGVLNALGCHQALEHGDELQVGGGRHVIGPPQLSLEIL